MEVNLAAARCGEFGVVGGHRCGQYDVARVGDCGGQRRTRLGQVCDHAPFGGFFGREAARGEQQLLGAPRADGAHEVLDTAAAGHDAAPQLGQRKYRSARSDDVVTHQRQFAAAAMRVAFDGGDHRLREILDSQQHLFGELVLAPPLTVGHTVALLEVSAGRECTLTGAGDDQHTQAVVEGQFVQGVAQVDEHLRVHRVHHLGAVEHQGADAISELGARRGFNA